MSRFCNNFLSASAHIKAAFYPKFENESSDHKIRAKMVDIVSKGVATLEVSLKHSGSLFMYAGHSNDAYSKNSYGNMYTAVGVFVLQRMFREAWGARACEKQKDFDKFLKMNRICVSMELVTAVLDDHGQHPQEDYVVVTAITQFGNGQPRFYSTLDMIVFCRTWRLPTNHVWLFSTRESVALFFAAYDALYENGTTSSVCKALSEVADISIPGFKDYTQIQGEILEGLVARIVNEGSNKQMEQVLRDFPLPPSDCDGTYLGRSLRELFASTRFDKQQRMKALYRSIGSSLHHCGSDSHPGVNAESVLSMFLQAHPFDSETSKLQELIHLMKEKHYEARLKFYNFVTCDKFSDDRLLFKLIIQVCKDSVFKHHQKEMRSMSGLWPLYRGFCLEISLWNADKVTEAELLSTNNFVLDNDNTSGATEESNLMIKLKFLKYKLRTFLMRNGLPTLFKCGVRAYKDDCLSQMKAWGISQVKQRVLSEMLDEWADHLFKKCKDGDGSAKLLKDSYLTEAEPFLRQYTNRSPGNMSHIGPAGYLFKIEDYVVDGKDEKDEQDCVQIHPEIVPYVFNPAEKVKNKYINEEQLIMPSICSPRGKEFMSKNGRLILFFPGIPGSGKSTLCEEMLNFDEKLVGNQPVYIMTADMVKGDYWKATAKELTSKPNVLMLADKNAPNVAVWKKIKQICVNTNASAIPIIPDSEGSDRNPFSLDALAVFIFRVLQRVNHVGNLDKDSADVGCVLLKFYHLYTGKSRTKFEDELNVHFKKYIKMPLLRIDREPLPDPVRSTLEEGVNLYLFCSKKQRRPEFEDHADLWANWEKKMRVILFEHAGYLKSVQLPLEFVFKQVIGQLRAITAEGDNIPQANCWRMSTAVVYAAIDFPVAKIKALVDDVKKGNSEVANFFQGKNAKSGTVSSKAHMTLAHATSHGPDDVASYYAFLHQEVAVSFAALFFSEKLAALEGHLDGHEKLSCRNIWPHVTIWTDNGVPMKDTNRLLQLFFEGRATRVEINPPVAVVGKVAIY